MGKKKQKILPNKETVSFKLRDFHHLSVSIAPSKFHTNVRFKVDYKSAHLLSVVIKYANMQTLA